MVVEQSPPVVFEIVILAFLRVNFPIRLQSSKYLPCETASTKKRWVASFERLLDDHEKARISEYEKEQLRDKGVIDLDEALVLGTEVNSSSTIHIRIIEEPLTAQ
ncbi:MAG: hypothetical protein ACHQ1H_11105, partial [Nitrososphaerales archaeon]